MNLKIPFVKMSVFKYTLFIFFCFAGIHSFAQSVVSSTGDHYQNTEYQLSSTMGETATTSLEKGDIALTQGFHQTRLTVTSVNEITDVDFKIKIYPNPTSDYLTIAIDEQSLDQCYYVIYSLNGEKLKEEALQGVDTQISFNEYSPSVYFVKVFIHNKEINTYKIIKQ